MGVDKMSRIEQISDDEVKSIDEIKEMISSEIKRIKDTQLQVLILGKMNILAKEYQNILKMEKYIEKKENHKYHK